MLYHAHTQEEPFESPVIRTPEIIRKTSTVDEFTRAVNDDECAAAMLPRPMDEAKQAAITATAEKIRKFEKENRTIVSRIPFKVSPEDIPKIVDPDNLLDDMIKDELELMAKIYYERTGIPELTTAIFFDFEKFDHDHNYPLINVVWDKGDTENSDEIGTTYITNKGRETAPLNALFWMQAYGYHRAKRVTDNGITFIVRPTGTYAASMPDLNYYSENS